MRNYLYIYIFLSSVVLLWERKRTRESFPHEGLAFGCMTGWYNESFEYLKGMIRSGYKNQHIAEELHKRRENDYKATNFWPTALLLPHYIVLFDLVVGGFTRGKISIFKYGYAELPFSMCLLAGIVIVAPTLLIARQVYVRSLEEGYLMGYTDGREDTLNNRPPDKLNPFES